MSTSHRTIIVAIATPLEARLVDRIRETNQRVEVRYQPDLLPPVRYPNDHRGIDGYHRDRDGQRRWERMLDEAEVLFGLPGDSPDGLARVVRSNSRLRWVQATAAGAGEQVRTAGLSPDERVRVTVTTASGVHAGPLAEFCMFGLLAFTKNLPRLLADQHARRWAHHTVKELAGSTLVVVGLGSVGTEVATRAASLGMRVLAVNRHPRPSPQVERVYPPGDLSALLPEADGVVLTLPLTPETRGMIDARAIARLKRGAVLVNVGRGPTVDEEAMIDALRDGRIAGAALDVFSTEPLPTDSPLWGLSNVLLSPHTAGLSEKENERIVDLFEDNLRRYLEGAQLLNRVDPISLY